LAVGLFSGLVWGLIALPKPQLDLGEKKRGEVKGRKGERRERGLVDISLTWNAGIVPVS